MAHFDPSTIRFSQSRRSIFALILILIAIIDSAQAVAQDLPANKFPYQAIVSAANAEVFSGPGSVHYVTANLRQGATVEVYRHDPGGWCAIRPTKGSFSLIPATAVAELGKGIGEITEEGTQAWVGTHLGPVEKPLWQVKLRAGEKVVLLGIATWPDPDGFTTSWYQIEPPAGEFRWVKLSQLKLPAAISEAMTAKKSSPATESAIPKEPKQSTESAKKKEPQRSTQQSMASDSRPADINLDASHLRRQNQATEASAPASKIALTSLESEDWSGGGNSDLNFNQQRMQQDQTSSALPSDQNQLRSTGTGWRKARFPIARSSISESNLQSPDRIPPDRSIAPSPLNRSPELPDRYASADLNTRFDSGSLGMAQGGSGWSNETLTAPITSYSPTTPRMTELELKLNQEMIKEPNQWQLITLQNVAQQVAQTSGDRLEQEHARRFLEKLERCRQLRDQYLRINTNGTDAIQGLTQSSNLSNSNDLSLNTLYDAHGWLKELVQEGGRLEPTYVLQNESGKITHHVLPGPGMNLSSYVSKRIGVIGQRGYHTRLKLDHVTVQKVIELK